MQIFEYLYHFWYSITISKIYNQYLHKILYDITNIHISIVEYFDIHVTLVHQYPGCSDPNISGVYRVEGKYLLPEVPHKIWYNL